MTGTTANPTVRGNVGPREERVFRAVNGAPDLWHVIVWPVMQFGSLGSVWVTAAGLARRRRPEAATVAIAGTAVWAGVKLVKPLVGRGRPAHHLDDVKVRGPEQTGLGFPSGHAAVSTTLAVILRSRARKPARIAFAGAAVATGVGRVYVGAHLPHDVLAGHLLGLALGSVSRRAMSPRRASRRG